LGVGPNEYYNTDSEDVEDILIFNSIQNM